MTAQDANRAIDGVWARLKRVKDKWVLVAFLASTLVWMEGTVRAYVALPEQFEQQSLALEGLARQVSVLDNQLDRAGCGPLYRRDVGALGQGRS